MRIDLDKLREGLYTQTGYLGPDVASLAGAMAVKPSAMMSLTSTLVYHRLVDDALIPTRDRTIVVERSRYPTNPQAEGHGHPARRRD